MFLAILFIVWASIAKIDITLSTQGKLSTEVPNVSVQANYNSVIREIFQSDGDRVQLGEPLIAFDETLLASDIRDAKISLSSANNTLSRLNSEIKVIQNKETSLLLTSQLAIYNSLVKEIKNHKSLNSSTIDRLKNDIDVLTNEIKEIEGKLNYSNGQKIETLQQKIFTIEQAIKIIKNESYTSPDSEPHQLFLKL